MSTPEPASATLSTWFPAFFALFMFLLLLRSASDIWRGGPKSERMKSFLDGVFGGIQGTALVAGVPINVAWLGVTTVLSFIFVVRDLSTGQVRSLLDAVAQTVIPPFLLLLALFFSVVLFGRPKVIIPPHLRTHGGVIPEFSRWAARRLSAAARDIRQR